MRISDWSSDVCSSDLNGAQFRQHLGHGRPDTGSRAHIARVLPQLCDFLFEMHFQLAPTENQTPNAAQQCLMHFCWLTRLISVRVTRKIGHNAFPAYFFINPQSGKIIIRSEEHPSELQSLMRISYAVFCLKKKQPHHLLI